MAPTSSVLQKLFALAASVQVAQAAMGACKDKDCGDCPVSTTTEGTGYPNCVIYNSNDVFTNFIDKNEDTGEWDVWFDIPAATDLGSLCYYIIKSPAQIGIDTCGVPLWTGQDAVCAEQGLKETFMVQFCCGYGDCKAAGVPGLPDTEEKRDPLTQSDAKTVFSLRGSTGDVGIQARASGGGLMLVDADGNVIPPAYVGPPTSSEEKKRDETSFTKRRSTSNGNTGGALFSKRSRCADDSWVDDGDEFITTAAGSQQVSDIVDGGDGGSKITITRERTSSWSTTMEASLGFEDILSLGVSFSSTFEESITDSEAYEFTVPAGDHGYVNFTPYVLCKKGTGTCDDQEMTGEVCTGYRAAGRVAGEYNVVTLG